jgi:hypothetical protein
MVMTIEDQYTQRNDEEGFTNHPSANDSKVTKPVPHINSSEYKQHEIHTWADETPETDTAQPILTLHDETMQQPEKEWPPLPYKTRKTHELATVTIPEHTKEVTPLPESKKDVTPESQGKNINPKGKDVDITPTLRTEKGQLRGRKQSLEKETDNIPDRKRTKKKTG